MSSLRTLAGLTLAAALAATPLTAQQDGQKSAPPARQNGTTSAEARAEFSAGWTDMFNAFFVRATEHFDKALQLDPSYGLARALRANAAPELTPAERKAQLDQALAEVAAAAPSTQEILNVAAWRAGDPKEQRALLTALVTLAPKNAVFAFRLAMTEQDPAARLKALQDITARFPDFAPAHNLAAYTLWDQGDHEGALREVQEYVKLLPDHPNPYDSYGDMLARAGRYPEALQQYGEAVKRAPDFAEGYAGMAEVYVLTGKLAEARAAWQQAIAHEPRAMQMNHVGDIACAYLLSGDRKRALQTTADFANAGNEVDRAAGHAYMAVLEGSFGNAAGARAELAEARKGPADKPGLRYPLALAAVYAGDLEAAKAAAEQAAAAGAKPLAHVLASLIASSKGDIATAQAELAQLSGTPVWLPKAFLAQALARAGKKAEARALRDEIQHSDVDPYSLLARAKVQKL